LQEVDRYLLIATSRIASDGLCGSPLCGVVSAMLLSAGFRQKGAKKAHAEFLVSWSFALRMIEIL
jgi:hypothetical protein